MSVDFTDNDFDELEEALENNEDFLQWGEIANSINIYDDLFNEEDEEEDW